MDRVDKNIVYHYCSLDTFNAIISNNTIRVCDLNKTNDYMEKQWGAKYIGEAINETFNELDIGVSLEKESYLKDILKTSIKSYIYEDLPILIACFSHEGDKLSQWRAYGDDGQGISLGFDSNILALLENEKMNILVDDVVYSKEKQLEIIKHGVNGLIEEFKKDFRKDGNIYGTNNFKEYIIEWFDEFCDLLCEWISNMASYIKNPAFSEESEFRISYNPNYPDEVSNWDEINYLFKEKKVIDKYEISPVKYYVRDNQLVAYCDINFREYIKDNILKNIIIGPKARVTQKDIYYYLFAKGYDTDRISIFNSRATYR